MDLHAFAIPGARGKYWYSNGVNSRAVVAWACGVAAGLMFSTTSLFTGPLESSVKYVDISWLVAAVVGGGVYLTLRAAVRYNSASSPLSVAGIGELDVS
jgi:cytosine/uracil/thiamine/allantoin permease